jgi:predicted transcriptional regulator
VAPRPQRRFEGSGRQLRGAIIRRLVSGPATLDELVTHTTFDHGSVEEAIADLESESLVSSTGDGFRLSD